MKVSKTLTNEELSGKVLDELEDIVLSVCRDVADGIDIQLRKGRCYLNEFQKEELIEHLREKVNLNLTINAGIQTKDLANIDIYPQSIDSKGLDSFLEEDEKDTTVTISANGQEGTTLSMEQLNKLPEFIEKNAKKLKEDEEFRAERKKRSEWDGRKRREAKA
jgi:hypothetical protein